ncbi:hypothetical protein DQ237_00355 [Blastococcus sp. TF02-8]|uniref:pentapeptide repeat-containing protein n=1 Tax=Blastococcus sp. TF02-8 TaxID=2250574 RepID=UPI000DEAB6FC|nr:pentapeptide repeat-containing protein [Blastococcus sp. TF02-8]RBY97456.1 hypothetical protein DQ237_00355 [Blastococcus sp. TF02-8]
MIDRVRSRVRRWFYEDADEVSSGRHAPSMPRMLPLLGVVAVGGTVVVWLVFVGLARLKGAHIEWWWAEPGDLRDEELFDLTRSTATLVALLGGLFAIVYAYRKQRFEEAAGRRADEENVRERDQALAERYQEAAAQLGHANAAVRLAGVHAMSRLADSWSDQRQTCVDVLCAYVRMPSPPNGDAAGDEGGRAAEHEVRHSVFQAIREHLQPDIDPHSSWSALRFDFSGATLDDLDLTGAHFHSEPRFVGTHFRGACTLTDASFRHGANFTRARFEYFAAHRVRVLDGALKLSLVSIGREGHWSFARVAVPAQVVAWAATVDAEGNFSLGVAERTDDADGAVPVTCNDVIVGAAATARIYCVAEPQQRAVHTAPVTATGWQVAGAAIIDRRLWDAELVEWKPASVSGTALLEAVSLPADIFGNTGWDSPANEEIPARA